MLWHIALWLGTLRNLQGAFPLKLVMAKNRILTDSIALASVKVITMATSILATMVLSRTLPLADYGTYSTGNLIYNTATLISALGLIDAVNYYFNGKAVKDRTSYVNSVFTLLIMSGGIVAAAILSCQSLITRYFHNPALGAIYFYIAFRPFLYNFSSGLQNLQVSIGKAKAVAIRNTVLSISKFGAILLASLYTKKISTIFSCMLIVETLAMLFYYQVLRSNNVHVSPFKPDWIKIREILVFCIPMGIYIQMNVLSRDLDKYVIGFFESTEMLAIYTNCSTKLPFDLVSGPLLTLLIPLLTRCIRNDDFKNSIALFRSYLKLGYTFTFTFGFACMILGAQVVQFLFGEKYAQGLPIFVIYVLVDMINFISYSLVLAAKGKTKELMKVSIWALAANFVINILFYKIMGFIGPAIATVVVTFSANTMLLHKSAKILKTDIFSLFDLKHILRYGGEVAALSIGSLYLKRFMESLEMHYSAILVSVGAFFVGTILLLNLNEIKKCFLLLNQINKDEIAET